MAKAFPASTFVGFDYHDESIQTARQRATEAGVGDRVSFEIAPASAYTGEQLRPGHDVRLPARHGRPGRRRPPRAAASLADDGTWMIVEPRAGDQRGGQPEPGRTRVLRVLDPPLHARLAVAGGRPRRSARRPARRASATSSRRPGSRVSAACPRRRFNIVYEARRSGTIVPGDDDLADAVATEQTRARYPDARGSWRATGCGYSTSATATGEPTILLLPTWEIVHSAPVERQIPYLARTAGRDVRSARQRPLRPAARSRPRTTASRWPKTPRRPRCRRRRASGRRRALVRRRCRRCMLAAEHPDRVERPLVAPNLNVSPRPDAVALVRSTCSAPTRAGRRRTATTGLRDCAGYLEYFFAEAFSEPHSTKQIEDARGLGLETDAETIIARRWTPLAQRRCRARGAAGARRAAGRW